MLSSLRSSVTRSLSLRSRLFSVQAEANQGVIDELFTTFGSTTPTNGSTTPTNTPAEGTPKPKPSRFNLNEMPPAQDPLLEFFASRMMERGHRARAEKSTSEVLLHIYALTKAPPLPILREAVDLTAPAIRLMRHKTGGKIVVKPVALNERQRTKKAIDWILEASKSRVGYTRGERVARECVRIIQGQSSALEKKETEHKLAMVSRGNVPRSR
ncbi:ribosomal protein S7 [Macrolepiota fuliginosa MF-IS2]|uniref:Ribosomal protein S7 n=1 Tax=Macrolepiota fuliginosa MF-IS2 TaxID=1400762 RepID=A0A9P6C105_9AGAR|nr:ribosomal protein S7 [Macrolepiota fuliginosa MF-IS2]